MKLILALDGGGTREKFSVELIKLIEHEMGLKMYEMFDMVVGVSAGAMSAAAIGMGKYDKIDDKVPSSAHIFANRLSEGLFSTMYPAAPKTAELNRMFGRTKMSELKIPTAILTVTTKGKAATFTNNDEDADKLTVANVVDASSAAPVVFPPVKINDRYYIDGGMVSNDPIFAGIEYALRLWPDAKDDIAVLSIGTGSSTKIDVGRHKPEDFGLVNWLRGGLLNIMVSNRNYNEPIIRLLLGNNNYIRITSAQKSDMSIVSVKHDNDMIDEANLVWSKHGVLLRQWLLDHGVPNVSGDYMDMTPNQYEVDDVFRSDY